MQTQEPTPRPRILFVEDDPELRGLIESSLGSVKTTWEIVSARSATDAFHLMSNVEFDAVVTDTLTPELSGSELLESVRQQHPQTLRFLMKESSEGRTDFHDVGSAHQFLSRPDGTNDLQLKLAKALKLRELLCNTALQRLVSRISMLPTIPTLYKQLLDLVDSPTSTIEAVGEVIERDMAICSKLLQIVNSAYFGLDFRVSSPIRAVSLLGIESVKALVLSAGISAQFPANFAHKNQVDWLWKHSIRVSRMAQKVAMAFGGDSKMYDNCFFAGLLHDIGELILISNCPVEYKAISNLSDKERMSSYAAERAVLGCSHADVGAYLLGIWGLPSGIVEAVAWHHEPSISAIMQPGPLLAVHVADCVQTGCDPLHYGDRPVIDQAFLAECGFRGQAGMFVDACRSLG